MADNNQEMFSIFQGPNRFADFSCVVFELEIDKVFSNARLKITEAQLNEVREFFPNDLYFSKIVELTDCTAIELICELAKFVQTEQYDLFFKSKVGFSNSDKCYIALSYFSLRGVQQAIRFAFNLTRHVVNKDIGSKEIFTERIKVVLQEQRKLQPDQTQTMMLNAAIEQNIPVYRYNDYNDFLCFGQGEKSVVFRSASSQFDSGSGVILQQDKYLTNQLLKTMGFPATELHVVKDIEAAKKAARELTYPVVVKPVGQGQGFGVSANIKNESELQEAFTHALRYRSYAVIIEKHVEGFDHRLVVANGKLIGAISRIPSTVVGDNKSTIKELIEKENNNRSFHLRRKGLIKDILVDDSLINFLSTLSYSLESVPKENEVIPLRSISNVSTGGVYLDVLNQVHPDTANMAVEVAEYFRLDVVGVDFLTTDISKSWREEGAINEINTTPMLFDNMARDLLSTKFLVEKGFDNNGLLTRGRITTILVIDDNNAIVDEIVRKQGFLLDKIATVNYHSQEYSLNGSDRKLDKKTFNEKCLALVSHPRCSVLFVQLSFRELIENGLPLDYFSYAHVNKDIIEELPEWISKNCGSILSF